MVPQLRESETLSEILEPIQLAYRAVALGGLACFLALFALLLHGRSTLKVRRLELRDAEGRQRAALSVTAKGTVELELKDGEQRSALVLSVGRSARVVWSCRIQARKTAPFCVWVQTVLPSWSCAMKKATRGGLGA